MSRSILEWLHLGRLCISSWAVDARRGSVGKKMRQAMGWNNVAICGLHDWEQRNHQSRGGAENLLKTGFCWPPLDARRGNPPRRGPVFEHALQLAYRPEHRVAARDNLREYNRWKGSGYQTQFEGTLLY